MRGMPMRRRRLWVVLHMETGRVGTVLFTVMYGSTVLQTFHAIVLND